MPMYVFRCEDGHTFERLVPLKEFDKTQLCECLTVAHRVIVPVMIGPSYGGYNCPITGKYIEGKAAHEANLKKHGCRVLEAGEAEATEKAREYENKKFEDSVAESAMKFAANLPTRKKEALVAELASGVGTEIVKS